LIYPVAVQGEASKTQIEMAIRKANIDKKCDVLILARGGGSIEDLWSFNEENVAKAIYNSDIPIICGVGHEIDFTIANFVADIRAPTPSAAAELITPERDQLLTDVVQTQLWMKQTISREIKQKQQHLDWLDSRLQLQKPSNRIQQQAQRLDDLNTRLQTKMNSIFIEKQSVTKNIETRLRANTPKRKISESQIMLSYISTHLEQSIKQKVQQSQSDFKIKMAMLDSISPLKTLDRGYAIIKDSSSENLITSKDNLKSKQQIMIQLKDGEANAKIL
jgi:exodeoxyribonuclease VII large subunit